MKASLLLARPARRLPGRAGHHGGRARSGRHLSAPGMARI